MALRVRPDVAAAIAAAGPVVALESTLIAHGLPAPGNLEVGREVEQIILDEGAVPATIGVIAGVATIGLDAGELERIAAGDGVLKLGARDLAPAAAQLRDGATTVAATAVLAARSGIEVFATGGLGGVHRHARDTWDESADLRALSMTSITVVCAGVKSILDVAATLERLESLGVTVVGLGTSSFPGFYLSSSGHRLDWSVDSPRDVADIMAARRRMRLDDSALVVANPLPADRQLDPALHELALTSGLALLREKGVSGKAVTPFLLEHFHRVTGGASLAVNSEIIRRNARVAAQVAVAVAAAGRR